MSSALCEPEESAPLCEVPGCGHELEFATCWACEGSGGSFPAEDFPLEYGPDEWEPCDECKGLETISWCEVHGRIDDERDRGNAAARAKVLP